MPSHPERVRRNYQRDAVCSICGRIDCAHVQAAPLWGLFFPIRYGTESRVTASGDPLPSESRVTANAIEGDTFTDFWGV